MQGLLRVFQDVSYLRAEDRGRGVAYQAQVGRAWFVLSWNIRLHEPPALSTSYAVDTYFYRARHALCNERLTLRGEGDKALAAADVLWGYVDTRAQQPTDCPQDYWEAQDFREAPSDACITRKIKIPAGGEELSPLTVREVHLDTNGHVNNVRFTELAMTLAGCEVGVRELHAEFLRQTFGHTVLYPYLWRGQGTGIALRDASGVPYAIFEFL
jgi:acyl-ACP thioesterase